MGILVYTRRTDASQNGYGDVDAIFSNFIHCTLFMKYTMDARKIKFSEIILFLMKVRAIFTIKWTDFISDKYKVNL